jgi:hypothetical protein
MYCILVSMSTDCSSELMGSPSTANSAQNTYAARNFLHRFIKNTNSNMIVLNNILKIFQCFKKTIQMMTISHFDW